MTLIAVPDLAKPEAKSHHKPRHLKKLAIGPFAQTCAEIRFIADIEKFDEVDAALAATQQQQGWDLFIAYFNEQYHVAINFFTEQAELEAVVAQANATIVEVLGNVELQVLAGDANYGDWDSCYAE
ncbi:MULTISPECIES: hypothetical protein [unclassified Agarivorans]|uniref:hypothetical protein n=1 Tax=unclassified Agarivorans TaxID=2636026 RepID=UPI0026E2DF29|nr:MULTISPECIES: hypothetical protein [unclassified Agarivorans]MDO6687209.1 hypothetical protein [Agarivorans sp. 3_MG-2023]MDO6716864.1 hypothetical protein [Agarivorans sp. 2_MG-2023]